MQVSLTKNTPCEVMEKSWQFCVGSGHAALALRQDYQEQLRYVHQELGIQRVRFHGIFCDDMNVIQKFHDFLPIPGSKKYTTQSFYQVGKVYDAILDMGMQPFVELGFMPTALASGRRSIFHYKGNVTPPKDYNAWAALIQDFIRFLQQRYGKEEIRSWYFEVWNEPDLAVFWSGSRREYFKLYAVTARAIKEIDPLIPVGGPATAGNRWIPETLEYCRENQVPIDFVSTHMYPGDAIGIPINFKTMATAVKRYVKSGRGRLNDKIRNITYSDEIIAQYPKGTMTEGLKRVRRDAGDLPLFYTEWNCCAICSAPMHDTRQSAAFAVKTILDNKNFAQGYAHWSFSDIFEELFFFPEPFSGSFGLLTIHGIPKPSFWAYKLLAQLGTDRFVLPQTNTQDVEYAVFQKENLLQILIYHQEYLLDDARGKETVAIRFSDLPEVQNVTVQRIDDTHANPKQVWEDMGSPIDLLPGQVAAIKEVSCLQEEEMPFTQDGDTLTLQTQIGVNDIQLIQIYLQA